MGGCRSANDKASKERQAPVQIAESEVFGKDSVVGLLHVTNAAAYFQNAGNKIRLIQAAPVVAMGPEALMAEAATALRPLAGQYVWARGELKGDILWSAEVNLMGEAPASRE